MQSPLTNRARLPKGCPLCGLPVLICCGGVVSVVLGIGGAGAHPDHRTRLCCGGRCGSQLDTPSGSSSLGEWFQNGTHKY